MCVVRGSKGKNITQCCFVCLFAKDTLAFARNDARQKNISTVPLNFLKLSLPHLLNLSLR